MEEAMNNEAVTENEQVSSDSDLDRQELEQDVEQQIEQRVQERLEAERLKSYAAGKANSENISPYFLKFVDVSSEDAINNSFKELHKAIDDSSISPNMPYFMKSTTNRTSLADGEGLSRKTFSEIINSARKANIEL